MAEDFKNEVTKKEVTASNDSKEALSVLVERNERAAAELKETLSRIEELKAKEILGGGTQAGSKAETPKEISPRDYVNALSKGIILK